MSRKIHDCLGALNSLMSAISMNSLSLIHPISDAAHPKAGDNGESLGLARDAPHYNVSSAVGLRQRYFSQSSSAFPVSIQTGKSENPGTLLSSCLHHEVFHFLEASGVFSCVNKTFL